MILSSDVICRMSGFILADAAVWFPSGNIPVILVIPPDSPGTRLWLLQRACILRLERFKKVSQYKPCFIPVKTTDTGVFTMR